MDTPFLIAGAVLNYVESRLVACRSEPVTSRLISVGEVYWDDACGQLAVMIGRTYRANPSDWPNEYPGDATSCGDYLWAVELDVVLIRCVPTLSKTGKSPDPVAVSQASARVYRDGQIILDALGSREILGDDGAGDPEWERARLSQDFLSGGGAAAITTHVVFGVPACSFYMQDGEPTICPPDYVAMLPIIGIGEAPPEGDGEDDGQQP